MKKMIKAGIDLNRYDDGYVLMIDGEPDSVYNAYEDASNARYWSKAGDVEYGLGSHDYEIKEWRGGKLVDDVTSATKSSAVKLPKEYAKYYKAYPIDESYIEEIQEILDDYGLQYLGDAACKDNYLDAFSDNGIEYGTIARDEDGTIKVYLLAGGRVYDILDEVNIALEKEW